MKQFYYKVWVEAECRHDADQVMGARLGYDEELEDEQGRKFDYKVDWETLPLIEELAADMDAINRAVERIG